MTKLGSPSFRGFLVKFLPFRDVQKLRKMIDVMHMSSIGILEAKKTALQQGDEAVLNNYLAVKANMEAGEQDRLPESELLSQMT